MLPIWDNQIIKNVIAKKRLRFVIHCFILRMHSISIKKLSQYIPFSKSTMPYISRTLSSSGQCNMTCLIVCTPELHAQIRSSRFELGNRLSFSILRLWDPVRYLVIQTRWNSILPLYDGFKRFGFIIKYVPNFES